MTRLTSLGLWLILSGALVWLLAGCYPEPEPPQCFTATGLESADVACSPLARHEKVALNAFLSSTGRADHLVGWTVVIRVDGWSEKHGRACDDAPRPPLEHARRRGCQLESRQQHHTEGDGTEQQEQ